MNQAEHVIGLLGGVRAASDLLGAPLTTVQSWRDGGFIPSRRMRGILNAAQKAGIKLEPADFFVDQVVSGPFGDADRASAL
jgi:hypothetical protein